MDVKDGVVWIYGVGEDCVMAFTDFGGENLTESRRKSGIVPNATSLLT